MCASRTLFGAAKQAQFTKKLAKVNKHGQPFLANIIVGILSIYFTVFAPDAWVNYIYTIYGLTAGVVYLLVALSFLKLRRSHPEWERPYKLRIPWFFGIASIIFCIRICDYFFPVLRIFFLHCFCVSPERNSEYDINNQKKRTGKRVENVAQ